MLYAVAMALAGLLVVGLMINAWPLIWRALAFIVPVALLALVLLTGIR